MRVKDHVVYFRVNQSTLFSHLGGHHSDMPLCTVIESHAGPRNFVVFHKGVVRALAGRKALHDTPRMKDSA